MVVHLRKILRMPLHGHAVGGGKRQNEKVVETVLKAAVLNDNQ